MNYFTSPQFKVLKTCWLPALICILASILYSKTEFPYERVMITAGYFTFTFLWEFIILKEYKKGLLFLAAAAAVYASVILLVKNMIPQHEHLSFNIAHYLFNPAAALVLFLVRGFLLQKKSALVIALLTLIGWFFAGNYLGGFGNLITPLLYILFDVRSDFFSTIFTYGTFFSVPFIYYLVTYLAENYQTDASFIQRFRSKILVMGSVEYVFLYIILYTVMMGCAMDLASLGYIIGSLEEYDRTTTIYYLAPRLPGCFFAIGVSGYLLRNVIVSRSLTIGLHNGFLYFLHLVPFLNIIPLLIYAERKAVHTQPSENAAEYVGREPSAIANWIIIIGILVSLFGLYQGFNAYKYASYQGTLMKFIAITVIIFQGVRIVKYLMIRNNRNAVYVLIVVNCLSVALLVMGSAELVALRLMLAYASLYFLMEIFHPTLFGQDAESLPAPAYDE